MSVFALSTTVHAQDIATREVTYTTSKGTSLDITTSLTHDPIQDSKPVLNVNKTYELSIIITLNELGGDARDFHDVTFEIELTTSGLLSSGQSLFSAYHFDSTTDFTNAMQSKTYNFDILISGMVSNTDGVLSIEMSGKENVENNRDPSSTFDKIEYEVKVTGFGSFDSSLATSSTEVETRSVEVLTDESTKLGIEINMTHEGAVDGKPSMNNGVVYPLSVDIEILEIGPDPEDFHDLEFIILMEDSSITDYIPGNNAVRYYSGYSSEDASLQAGDVVSIDLFILANTNINDTEIDVKFTVKGKEDIPNEIDPSSEFNINIEAVLNDGLTNAAQNSDDEEVPVSPIFTLISIFLLAVMYRKRS